MTTDQQPLAAAVLDDFDARPGSATSLTRTVLGAYIRDLGSWIAVADFTELLAALGIPAPGTRTAITRLKSKGVLYAETRSGRAGYALTDAALAMFARGDPRIFGFRQMTSGDAWRLLSYAIPESERAARHQLRRRLSAIGCGTVSAGLWIYPEYLAAEAAAIITALDLDNYVTSFRATDPTVPGTLREAAAQWWDLDDLAARHRTFYEKHHGILDLDTSDRNAFAHFTLMLDEWRIIPYIDPGLPDEMLPADWPGPASVHLFAEARRRYLQPSRQWVRAFIDAQRVEKTMRTP
ncbi:PaaX family transcriptional regulator [Nocardia pseudovaccinii]|uniref:PaaX family transcriptional regulator n=1 Tax=Nocardia pseudovaccinii TaxID=189540 RepID=UPI0007A54B9E|nr:PaaX family transcriptional regulator C-terminal domain-containing protein [Nocardia pseudovaccinii]